MADLTPNPVRDGRHWLFADGTRLPIVAGGDGSDSIDAVLDRIEGGTTPEPTPAADAPTTADTDADAVDDPYDKGADTFDRAYVEKLRRENANRRASEKQARDELGRYTAAFDGLDDAARDSILAIPAYLRGGDQQRAELATWMRAQADGLTPAQQQQLADQVADAADDKDRPLTRAELQRELQQVFKERDDQQAVQRELSGLQKQVTDYGFEWDSPEATSLLQIAASHTGGDVAKAYDVMVGWAKKAQDQLIDDKRKDAGTPSPTPQSAGAAVAADKPISNLKDARERLEADLAAKGMK